MEVRQPEGYGFLALQFAAVVDEGLDIRDGSFSVHTSSAYPPRCASLLVGALPPAPEQKSMTVHSSVSMSSRLLMAESTASAASSAGDWRWMKGSRFVHCAVRVSWQQCFTRSGTLRTRVSAGLRERS